MKSNNLFKALAEGNNPIIMTTAADLKEFALSIAEEVKAQIEAANTSIRQPSQEQQKEETDKKVLTAKEVCQMLSVSMPTLWRWNTTGYLVPTLVGTGKVKRRKYNIEDVKRIMQQNSINC